jgi:hypothetical protein
MTRQGYIALSIAGVLLLLAGPALIGYGSAGSVPREDWLGQANVADVFGGLMCGGGLIAVLFGLSGVRSG